MAETWVEETGAPDNVDLVTIPANKNVIKVNDVNDNDDDKTALETINSSTNASAKAIEAEGQCEITVPGFVSDPALNALKITNSNLNANGRALLVNSG